MNDLSIKWKDFYKNVFALVVPMALQNLINVGVTAADVVMLGKVSEKVLSGASLAAVSYTHLDVYKRQDTILGNTLPDMVITIILSVIVSLLFGKKND